MIRSTNFNPPMTTCCFAAQTADRKTVSMKPLRYLLTALFLILGGLSQVQAQNPDPGRPQTCPTSDPAFVQTTPDSDFADGGNGTVTHLPTGLIWKRCAEGMTWDGAAKTCVGTPGTFPFDTGSPEGSVASMFNQVDAVNANQAGTQNLGFTDWRVPNIKELASIVEWGCFPQRINFTQFPMNPTGGSYGSSSPSSYDTSLGWARSNSMVWDSNWDQGWYTNYPTFLRLVRSGPSLQNFDALAIPPTLAGSPPTGTVGVVYAGFTPTTGPSNVTLPVTYAITAGSLPAGLVFDPATAAITGTPTQAGSFPITITASNAGGSASLPVTIVVNSPLVAPTLAGTPPSGMVGQPYAGFTPTTGPGTVTKPITYAITAGSLPPGLVFDPATGAITGTATQQGSFPITITATNAAGSANLPVVIQIGSVPPVQPAPIPTLGEWAMLLITMLVGGLAARRIRQRGQG